MFKSIRLKLTVWYSIVLLIALATFGITAYLYTGENLSRNLDISLRSEAQWLQEILEGKLNPYHEKLRSPRFDMLRPQASPDTTSSDEGQDETAADYTIWNKIYEHTLLNSKKQFVYIFDRRGRTFYKSFSLGQDTLPTPPGLKPYDVAVASTKIGDQRIRLAALDTKFYRIRVAYPEAQITEVLQNLFSIFLFLIPIVLVISVVGGYFLAKKSLGPVDEITQTARKITATNLRQRITIINPKDELGRLSETLNDMIRRLEASFEQVKQFSMDASHELRTPLTIMRGEIELTLKQNPNVPGYKKTLASVLDEVLRMASIIEGLILLAKADGGTAKLDKKATRLDLLVGEIEEDAGVLAERKQINVAVARLDQATINGDAIRLRQLMLNLVDNAIKYTPEGGRVTLSLERVNGNANFVVEDTGIGIPEKDLANIFDRFYRVDKSRSRQIDGLGLGLSISKWIAEAHGGQLLVESEVGKGSKFTVILPAASAPQH